MAKILAEEQDEQGQKIGIVLSLTLEEARLLVATHFRHIGNSNPLRTMWDGIAHAISEDADCNCEEVIWDKPLWNKKDEIVKPPVIYMRDGAAKDILKKKKSY